MKSKFLGAMILLVSLMSVSLEGLELEFSGGVGNISFDSGGKEPLSAESVQKPFVPQLFPLARAVVSGETGYMYYEGGFERDQILRNRIFANAGIRMTYFNMEAGPFIGVFNTGLGEIFNPGLHAAIGLEYPGVVFTKIYASSSLGNALETTGSSVQKTGGFSAGFWVPYVVCSLNMNSQSYAEKKEAGFLTEDSLTRYFFRADIFTKNVPFTVRVDLGYGILRRSYYSQSVSGTQVTTDIQNDEFKFYYVGTEFTYTVNSMFRFFLAGEIPVYSWSVPKMKNPEKNTFLFQGRGGIILSF